MIITDTTTCQNCEKDIHWYYQIPQRLSSGILDVDRIPDNKAKVFLCTHKKGNIYYLTCRCLKCDRRNTFEYESEQKLRIN